MSRKSHLPLLMSSLCLSSCSGTIGTIASRTWQAQGAAITEIRSSGFQARNIPGYRSISLGYHHTYYATRAPGATPTSPDDAPWTYGYCKGPAEMPIFLQDIITGSEASFTPTFVGISLGFTTRSTAVLPLGGNETMTLATPNGNPTTLNHSSPISNHAP